MPIYSLKQLKKEISMKSIKYDYMECKLNLYIDDLMFTLTQMELDNDLSFRIKHFVMYDLKEAVLRLTKYLEE
jgi:hypothetical protein